MHARRSAVMPSRPRHLLTLGLAVVLAAGCSDNADREADTASTRAAVADPAPVARDGGANAQAQAYYAALVERYDGGYAACGESLRTRPQACGDVRDIRGAGGNGPANVLVMLDASGSMAGKVGGERKLSVAQDALLGFSRKLPDDARLALRVYGHTGNNKDSGKAESCAGSALLQGFGAPDPARFEQVVRSVEPVGWTPIAASLDAAAGDFASAGDEARRNIVYIVSDGIETCSGDPVAAARRLNQSDVRVVVNVVGFDVGSDDAGQLRAVAEAGGGDYLAAGNRAELQRIFNARSQEAHARYNCSSREQHAAYNATSRDQHARHNCLSRRAHGEYNDISRQAHLDLNDKRIDREQLEHALSQARRKRDDILDPAQQERDAVLGDARRERDHALGRELRDRDDRLDDARLQREREQPR